MPGEVSENEVILTELKEELGIYTRDSIQISRAIDNPAIVYTRDTETGQQNLTLKGLITNYFNHESRRIHNAHLTYTEGKASYWLQAIKSAVEEKANESPALQNLPALLTGIVEAVEQRTEEQTRKDAAATKEWMGELFDEALSRFDKPLFPAGGRTGRSM